MEDVSHIPRIALRSLLAGSVVAAAAVVGCSKEPETGQREDAGEQGMDAAADARQRADAAQAAQAADAADAAQTPPRDASLDASRDASRKDARTRADASTASPRTLADTGLYADAEQEILAAGVHPYRPRFELWSDGADKRRWLKLPEGSSIDTSNMNAWVFPVGTKVWKEFARDGMRLETRLLHKKGPGLLGWESIAFAWNREQTQAVAAPEGGENVLGTSHDIPDKQKCLECHAGQPDVLLGVSAIQLAHPPGEDDGTLSLSKLAADGRVSPAPDALTHPLPGDTVTRQALGRMHANCGHCHSPLGTGNKTDLDTWLTVGALDSVEATPTYQTTVGVPIEIETEELSAPMRIRPGKPGESAMYERMTRRGDGVAMPPIATEEVDQTAADAVRMWIEGLPGAPCAEDVCDAGF